VEPALRALMGLEGFDVQGFLCPGHVGTIIGERGFRFLPKEYGMPAVISGFEPEDILLSVYGLLKQIREGKPRVQNEYKRAVAENGNVLAQRMLERAFEARTDLWRGLGSIEKSGLGLREELRELDAQRRFGLTELPPPKPTACRCGDVITGRMGPKGCPLFGKRCTPEDPVGPCMVSSEGACAAAYKYQTI
jgi:hydrogenase expression/formation protein HypD